MPASASRSVSANDVYWAAGIGVMHQPGQVVHAVALPGPDAISRPSRTSGVLSRWRLTSRGCGGRRRRRRTRRRRSRTRSGVGEVGDPELVRARGDEVAVDEVRPVVPRRVGGSWCAPASAADRAGDAELAHEPFDGAAGDVVTLRLSAQPDLPGAVDAVRCPRARTMSAFSCWSRSARSDGPATGAS